MDTIIIFQLIEQNSTKEVIKLIDNGYPINQVGNNGYTLLHYAVKCSNLPLVEHILKCGASVDLKIKGNKNLLKTALAFHSNLPIVKLLIDAGIDISSYPQGLMEIACQADDDQFTISIVERLIKSCSANVVGDLLHSIIFYDRCNVAEYLINNSGIKLNIKLFDFYRIASARMLEILTNNFGDQINIKNYSLLEIFKFGRKPTKFIINLLSAGVNEVDEETGNSVLHYAVKTRSSSSVMLLLDYGADKYHENKVGITPLEYVMNMDQLHDLYNKMVNHHQLIELKEPDMD